MREAPGDEVPLARLRRAYGGVLLLRYEVVESRRSPRRRTDQKRSPLSLLLRDEALVSTNQRKWFQKK